MAAEIAKLHKPAITILLSSVPSNTHLPFYFKWAYRFRLHKLVPVSLLKSASILKRGLTPDSPEDKEVLKQVIKDSDPRFIKWAMQAILSWKNEEMPHPYQHIHGTKDEVIPYKQAARLAKENPGVLLVTIEGGRHNNLNDSPAFQQQLNSILQLP